jgi:hypothetical protein
MLSTLLRRRITQALIVWTTVAAFLAFLIYRNNRETCENSFLGQEGCEAAGVGASFWEPFFSVWLIGLVIGGIVWAIVRPKKRLCPACGVEVQRGETACPSCGHDFAAAAKATVAQPPTGSAD